MKKITSFLCLLLMFAGAVTAWAGSQTLPTISENGSKTYYAIKNVRSSHYVYYSADNTNLLQSSTNSIYGVFYFTAGTSTTSTEDAIVVKIHNLGTENLLASVSSFTSDGVDWFIKAHSKDGKTGIAIASGDTFDGKTQNSWNDDANAGKKVAAYWADDAGSIFEVVKLTDAEVIALAKSRFSLEAYKSATGSGPFLHSETDYNTLKSAYDTNIGAETVPTEAQIKAMTEAESTFTASSTNALTDGTKAILGNEQHTDYYVCANSSAKLAIGQAKDSYAYIFTFKASGTGWKIYNEYYNMYVAGVPTTNNTAFTLTSDEDAATAYTIAAAGLGYASISDPNVTNDKSKFWGQEGCNAMHASTSYNTVICWTTDATPSHFKFITDATELTAVEDAAATALIAKGEALPYGTTIGTYVSTDAYTTAKTTLNATHNLTNYKALETAIAGLTRNEPDPTKYYTIKNEGNTDPEVYLTEDYATQANNTNKLGQTKGSNILPSLWKFEAVTTKGKTDLFYIVAANSGSCISRSTWDYTAHLVEKTSNDVGMYDLFNTTAKSSGATGVTLTHYTDDTREAGKCGTLWVTGSDIKSWNNPKDDKSNTWLIEVVDEIPVNVSAAKYATLYLPMAVTIPSGFEGQVFTGTAGTGVITLTQISGVIPALTPVIIHAEAGEYNFPIATSNESTVSTTATGLSGTLVPTAVETDANAYILKNGSNGIGMYKVTSTDRTIPENKAYAGSVTASSSTAGEAAMLMFNFGETTGISSLVAPAAEGNQTYYDLNGRRVLYPANGIFVTASGKKVFIK